MKRKPSMKLIETQEQFEQWAKEVNSGLTTEEKCDYQDVIGRSKTETLKKLYIEYPTERSLVTHSLYVTMGYDMVHELLGALAKHKAQAIIDQEIDYYNKDYVERLNELHKKEEELNRKEREFEAIKEKLSEENEEAKASLYIVKGRLEECRSNYFTLCDKITGIAQKADSFDTIKELLSKV